MAHYAFLNMQNIVTEVIVGKDETEGPTNWEIHYGNIREQVCKRTSYNTVQNQHTNGETPFRGNFAGEGMIYDADNDVFVYAKPFDSWVLDTDTWSWKPPIEHPEGEAKDWDEETGAWVDFP